MLKINDKKLLIWLLLIFLAVEFLSFWGFKDVLVGQLALAGLGLVTAALAVYKLEYGLLVILAELFIGSMGHLFYSPVAVADFNFRLGIRTLLWAVFMLIFIIKFLIQLKKDGRRSLYWQAISQFFSGKFFAGGKLFKSGKWFLILFLLIFIGLMNGLLRNHSLALIFSDFNAWFYLLLLFPLLTVYNRPAENNTDGGREAAIKRLELLFLLGAFWVGLKTLFLLFVFTHDSAIAPEIYLWLRRTLVGEMTPTKSGWPRVFIQGQIFPVIAIFFIFWYQAVNKKFQDFFRFNQGRKNLVRLFLAALFFTSLLISFSRSFWVAFVATGFLSWLALWRRNGFKPALCGLAWLTAAAVSGFLLIYLTVAFPYLKAPSANLSANLIERVTGGSNEPALASRWSLLPILGQEIKKEPVLGQGFGATVTYFSRDPRILENNPSGEYTTYAFEWGYLDIWLKIGLLGLVSYLFLILQLIVRAWRQRNTGDNTWLKLALATGLIFLVATNIFTPYLNHPLGLGFLLIASCLI